MIARPSQAADGKPMDDKVRIVRQLEEATPEFEKLEWLKQVVVFGPALDDRPLDSDVDLLLVANRTLSGREKEEATERLKPMLERRVKQPFSLRITTDHALESERGRHVGSARHLARRHVSVFHRD